VQVSGTLTSKPKTTFNLEFFATETSGASGRIFLGTLKVKTNSAGVANFTFLGPQLPIGVSFITATATDPSNNTAEFSNSIS
jgi:hypothetical protein